MVLRVGSGGVVFSFPFFLVWGTEVLRAKVMNGRGEDRIT